MRAVYIFAILLVVGAYAGKFSPMKFMRREKKVAAKPVEQSMMMLPPHMFNLTRFNFTMPKFTMPKFNRTMFNMPKFNQTHLLPASWKKAEKSGWGSLFSTALNTGIKLAPAIGGIVQGSIALHQNQANAGQILQHSLNSAGALAQALRAEEKPEQSFSFGGLLSGISRIAPTVIRAAPAIGGIVQGSIALHQNKAGAGDIFAHSMNSAAALAQAIRAEESNFLELGKKLITPVLCTLRMPVNQVLPQSSNDLVKKGVKLSEEAGWGDMLNTAVNMGVRYGPTIGNIVQGSVALANNNANAGQIIAHTFNSAQALGQAYRK